MTNYEYMIKSMSELGPLCMAEVYTELLFTGIKVACKQLGREFEPTDEMRLMSIDEYLEFLKSEYEEKKND